MWITASCKNSLSGYNVNNKSLTRTLIFYFYRLKLASSPSLILINFMGAKHKNKKGFTLIELLIVIAIIGILASVVLVNLTIARMKAQRVAYISYVSQMTKLVEATTVLGAFDGSTHLLSCLGNYGGTCWNGNYSDNADVNNRLLTIVSAIPQGVSHPLYPTVGTLIRNQASAVRIYSGIRGGDENLEFCPPGGIPYKLAGQTQWWGCYKDFPK